jgi:hypothetical protein
VGKLQPAQPLIVLASIFDLSCLLLSLFVGNRQDIPLNIMSVILGMGLSVPTGFLLTPLTKLERFQFSSIGKALLTFVSGYLVSKLDRTIEAALAPDFLLTVTGGFRLAAFVLCFGLGVPAVYLARLQYQQNP